MTFPLPLAPLELGLALGITGLAALVQGTLGFGFAILCVPLLALVDPRLVPVPQLLLTLPMTCFMAYRERAEADLRGVLWILLGRVPGALLGLFFLSVATGAVLDAWIGVMVLGAVVILGSGRTITRTPVTQFVAGVISGTSSLVSAIGGPPVALLYGRDRGATVRSTLASVFLVGILITLVTRLLGGAVSVLDGWIALILSPALAGGLALSRSLHPLVEGPRFRPAVLIVSGLAGMALLLRAVLSA